MLELVGWQQVKGKAQDLEGQALEDDIKQFKRTAMAAGVGVTTAGTVGGTSAVMGGGAAAGTIVVTSTVGASTVGALTVVGVGTVIAVAAVGVVTIMDTTGLCPNIPNLQWR